MSVAEPPHAAKSVPSPDRAAAKLPVSGSASKAASIEFRNVTKRYGDVAAVSDISFEIASGTLVLEPAVLLFDEPLSNLDARLRRQMREEIRDLQRRLSLTVVYVTHDQAEAMAVSDRIIVMNKAVIAQEGAPRDLYEQPRDPFVAGFMGDANRVHGTLKRRDATRGDVTLGAVTLTLPHRGLPDGAVEVSS